jgi:hypothetical protein
VKSDTADFVLHFTAKRNTLRQFVINDKRLGVRFSSI